MRASAILQKNDLSSVHALASLSTTRGAEAREAVADLVGEGVGGGGVVAEVVRVVVVVGGGLGRAGLECVLGRVQSKCLSVCLSDCSTAGPAVLRGLTVGPAVL